MVLRLRDRNSWIIGADRNISRREREEIGEGGKRRIFEIGVQSLKLSPKDMKHGSVRDGLEVD